ncbi:zonular occludens toxin [Stenotrophomonas sp. ATCM1_4]|uniref:zonular occludens toxin domain-containing protein n=1 Tax=Stenotrophomonas sp. ATCM1_4 TaxID=2259330 RepID=UPI00104ED9F6|nr:zonular occludens toxin domain-containing protein [Stenotrophomonas sp. ATCM1_4]TDB26201.1 zonular occludens toxin [Stenotrophomonas sp. ATCM1_4]
MGLYLVTGQPGHGKTAYGLDKAFKWQKEGRKIYIHGVKDFDYERAGFTYLQDPTKWEDLPDGSVVLLDECYTIFPNRNPGAKVPEHVEAMARHRHRGFDFILIAQQGLQLDPFLRGLYEEHVHIRQTSIIKSRTKLKRWTQYQSNVQGHCADVIDWVRPNYVFDYYTSTTLITTRRSLPRWAIWIMAGVAFLFVLGLYLKHSYEKKLEGFEADSAASTAQFGARTGAVGGTPGAPGTAPRYATATEYAKAHLPRFASMPETAPIFDERAPVSQPALFCMSSVPGGDDDREASCTCLTEQGTKYDISQPECRTLARFGPVYNPYKAPKVEMQSAPVPDPGAPPVAVTGSAGQVIGYTAGKRADPFARNPAKPVASYTPATSTL